MRRQLDVNGVRNDASEKSSVIVAAVIVGLTAATTSQLAE